FDPILLADVDPVSAGVVFLAETRHVLSGRIEDHDGVHRHLGPIAVLNVDEARLVDRHAMRLSPLDMRRELAPVWARLVDVLALADDRSSAPRFVLRPENGWPGGTRCDCGSPDRLDELSPRLRSGIACRHDRPSSLGIDEVPCGAILTEGGGGRYQV